jgi:hypothetical protein
MVYCAALLCSFGWATSDRYIHTYTYTEALPPLNGSFVGRDGKNGTFLHIKSINFYEKCSIKIHLSVFLYVFVCVCARQWILWWNMHIFMESSVWQRCRKIYFFLNAKHIEDDKLRKSVNNTHICDNVYKVAKFLPRICKTHTNIFPGLSIENTGTDFLVFHFSIISQSATFC